MITLVHNNHIMVKNSHIVGRDIAQGHVYKKVYTNGISDQLLFQLFIPKANITLNTIETWNFQSNASNFAILDGDHKIIISSKNTTGSIATETIGTYSNVIHHTYNVNGNVTLTAGTPYGIMINPNANWLADAAQMTAYFAVEQDGNLSEVATMRCEQWLADLIAGKDPGYDCDDIGGFALTQTSNFPQAFIMMNGINIMEV